MISEKTGKNMHIFKKRFLQFSQDLDSALSWNFHKPLV